ncbi:MAG: ABC transporter permease, partial [Phycisphaerae bacterium]
LAVHHRTTLTIPLPEGMRRKIEALDPERKELVAVCGMRWYGGRVPDTQNTLRSMAADADTFPIVYSETEMTPEQVKAWRRDRQACVVGSNIAEKYGWTVGDRLTLNRTVPPYLSLEFHVVKIMDHLARGNSFYFRRDFLTEAFNEAGVEDVRCNIFWVKCRTPEGLRSMQNQIDELFANSPDATKTEDENALMASFTQMAGNLPGMMQVMAGVVVFIVALVAGNTMMMSFRERTRELAVFKAIGFSRARIFSVVISESVLLSVIGALMGVLPVTLALTQIPRGWLTFSPISQFRVSPLSVAASVAIALSVGLAAGFWPALQAMRLRTTDALRRVG